MKKSFPQRSKKLVSPGLATFMLTGTDTTVHLPQVALQLINSPAGSRYFGSNRLALSSGNIITTVPAFCSNEHIDAPTNLVERLQAPDTIPGLVRATDPIVIIG